MEKLMENVQNVDLLVSMVNPKNHVHIHQSNVKNAVGHLVMGVVN